MSRTLIGSEYADGGGIRGYSSLVILRALIEKIAEIERRYDAGEERQRDTPHSSWRDDERDPLPCHYFDYAVGTSTGGLSAIMLGRLRMTVTDCLREYETLGKEIFSKRRTLHWNQYDYRVLERVFLEVIGNHCRDTARKEKHKYSFTQPDATVNECRTSVLAVRMNKPVADEPYMFRSYPYTGNADGNDTLTVLNPLDNVPAYIWQAARATSAAPHYFREVMILGKKFMDGGVKFNNPSFRAFCEAANMHQRRPAAQRCSKGSGVGIVVSIGTGKAAPLSMFKSGSVLRRIHAIIKSAIKDLSDPEQTHEDMINYTRIIRVPYFRFNVETSLEDMKMDECKADPIARLDRATRRYLDDQDTKYQLRRCAEYLVAYRRGRCPTEEERRFRSRDLFTPGPQFGKVRHATAPNGISNGAPIAGQRQLQAGAPHSYNHGRNGENYLDHAVYQQATLAQTMGELPVEMPHGYDTFELADHRDEPREAP